MNASQRALVVGLIGLGLCGVLVCGWVLAARGGGERPVRDQYSPLYLRTLQDAVANWRGDEQPQPAAHQHAPAPSASLSYDDALAQGRAAFDKKAYREALQSFAAAAQLRPQSAMPWAHMGDSYIRLGLSTQAIAAYMQCTKLSPQFIPGWYGLGIAYRFDGKPQQAIQAFETVKQMNPNDTFADQQIKVIRRELGAQTQPAG